MNNNNKCQLKRNIASSVFLSNIVSKGIHQWRFKYESNNTKYGGGTMYIGIINNQIDATKYLIDKCYPLEAKPSELFGKAYGGNFCRGQLRGDKKREKERYCPRCKNGDIIDMFLDFKNKELRYYINDRDYGKAFDIKDGSYRASVTLYYSKDRLTLMFYKYNSK